MKQTVFLIAVVVAATHCAAAFADVPYLADTSTKPFLASQVVSVIAGMVAVATGNKARILLVSSIAVFVVAIVLPQIAVYSEPPPELLYLRALANERLGNAAAAASDRANLALIAYQPEPTLAKHFALHALSKAK